MQPSVLKLCKELGIDPAKVKMMEEYEPKNCLPDDGQFFAVENNKRVYINNTDMMLISGIRKLPVATRVHIMGCTDDELEAYLVKQKASYKKFALELISKKWYWRETGDPADFSVMEDVEGLEMTMEQYIRKVKANRVITKAQHNAVIRYFTGDYSPLYQKD